MKQFRFPIFFLVFPVIFLFSIAYGALAGLMKEPPDLSSGFGDFRKGRFHAGVDYRTGGVTGKELFSPVDGYVTRIRMSYYGYGKGLYVKGDDGYLYVFGHLSGFVPAIERVVTARQMSEKRYFVELEFPADSARVKKGQLLGYTGQTGVGAPHLHFEKRTSDNIPLNPLTHGFPIKDKVKPFFVRIGFQLVDETSLFLTGQRKLFVDVPASATGKYRLDTIPYFSAPFGVLADCFDRMREGGMRQAVYKLSLYIDGAPHYQVVMDTIRFETGKAADLVYDYQEATDGEPRVRRLFHRVGNDFEGTHSHGDHLGLVGAGGSFAAGKHTGKIVAEDAFGNKSELTFAFVWGPPNVWSLDSAVTVSDTSTNFYFTGGPGVEKLGIDTVQVYLNRGDGWGMPPSIDVTELPNGRLKAAVYGSYIDRLTLRLVSLTRDSCRIVDFPFIGLVESDLKPAAVHHEVTEDGLVVIADIEARLSYPAQAELYYRDRLLGIEKMSQFFTMKRYLFFIPPRPAYAQIDKIRVRLTDDTTRAGGNVEDNLLIRLVGIDDSVRVRPDAYFSVAFERADVYEPRFIEVKKNEIGNKSVLFLNSEHYQVLPEDVLLKGNFRVTLETDPRLPYLDKTALYRLDKEENKWVWNSPSRDVKGAYGGTTRSGGSFALVYDLEPPVISGLNVNVGQTVADVQPTIRFTLKDGLSGIEDDRNIVIKLDGKWQIPEYDAEAGICQTRPIVPLTPGDHHLSIEVTDRVGNEAHQYLQFKVRASQPRKQVKGS